MVVVRLGRRGIEAGWTDGLKVGGGRGELNWISDNIRLFGG